MESKKHIVVLTGAGISAESGLKTFRDSDGLWNGYDVYEVATPEGYAKNPQLVLDFYNDRRKDVAAAQPNDAHKYLAKLEKNFDVTIITQNIDDLHERAGSSKVIHLHGEIFKMCSDKNKDLLYHIDGNINLGDKAEDGGQLRPFIVWFGEDVPMMEYAAAIATDADIFMVIGTSLQVYPAASLVNYAPPLCTKIVIDKNVPQELGAKWIGINKPATEGVLDLDDILNTL